MILNRGIKYLKRIKIDKVQLNSWLGIKMMLIKKRGKLNIKREKNSQKNTK